MLMMGVARVAIWIVGVSNVLIKSPDPPRTVIPLLPLPLQVSRKRVAG